MNEMSTTCVDTNMPFMFYCVNDETITIGEHLALPLEPRERIALRWRPRLLLPYRAVLYRSLTPVHL